MAVRFQNKLASIVWNGLQKKRQENLVYINNSTFRAVHLYSYGKPEVSSYMLLLHLILQDFPLTCYEKSE